MFSSLVGAVGWGGAAFWQLTVLPLVGVGLMLFLKTDQLAKASSGTPH